MKRPTISRRLLLSSAAGGVAASLVKSQTDAVLGATQLDPTKMLGRVPSALGSRAPEVAPRRLVSRPVAASVSRTPIQDLFGIITPSDLHFERHHAGVPTIAADEHELLIHGMVDRPKVFRMADLHRLPSVTRTCFIECGGQGAGISDPTNMPTERTPQQLDGLLSTSEWTGVPLSTVLREVGIRDAASWLLAEGRDAAVMSRSIPIGKALDDALLAYGQNGEPVRPEQGYPVRLLLPGWEGNTQVKWLRRIEVTDRPTMTRDETSRYTEPLGDGTARQFSFVMEAKSLITFPSYPFVLPERGWWEIRGLAWSGRGRIQRVDVSTDLGRTWTPAEIQAPVLSKAPVRFRHLWDWDGSETVILSRAVDETGYVQPTLQQLLDARGVGTGYHMNHIRAWHIANDGSVTFGLGALQ